LNNLKFWIKAGAIFAIVFGILTIISGGRVLFSEAGRQEAGNYVGFVLWFNFLAGFFYVAAGGGLWAGRRWSVSLALAITVATLLVLAFFAAYVLTGGAYELRTVIAMIFRAVVWAGIYGLARSAIAKAS
jgi:hypothetical protein